MLPFSQQWIGSSASPIPAVIQQFTSHCFGLPKETLFPFSPLPNVTIFPSNSNDSEAQPLPLPAVTQQISTLCQQWLSRSVHPPSSDSATRLPLFPLPAVTQQNNSTNLPLYYPVMVSTYLCYPTKPNFCNTSVLLVHWQPVNRETLSLLHYYCCYSYICYIWHIRPSFPPAFSLSPWLRPQDDTMTEIVATRKSQWVSFNDDTKLQGKEIPAVHITIMFTEMVITKLC